MPTSDTAPQPPRNIRRVRTPTLLQMESVECGATALGIVLAHFQRFVSLEELRVACGVSRDGSKAGNLVRAARTYGLAAQGHRKEPAGVFDLPLPVVVFWEFNHFLVVEGYRNGRVFLNDPAKGPRVVTWEEFDQGFTGIAIELRPDAAFRPGGLKPNVVRALATRLRGTKAALVFAVLTSLLLVFPGLLIPTFLQIFVDEILIGGMAHWVRPFLIGMVLTLILQVILAYLQDFYLTRLEVKISVASSARFFWHVMRLPVSFFLQRYAGEIGGRIQYSDQIAALLSGQLASALLNLLMILFYASVMFQYDRFLTVIGVVTAGLNFGFLRIMTRRRADANQQLLQERGKMQGTALGGIQMIETLKASGAEGDFFAMWAGRQALVINGQQKIGIAVQWMNVLPQFFLALNTALVLGVGGVKVMNGALTMGELMAFTSLIVLFLNPVNHLVNLGGSLQDIQGMITRVDDVLRHPLDPSLEEQQEPLPGREQEPRPMTSEEDGHPPGERVVTISQDKLCGQVEIKDLCFGYNPLDPPLIENFSLDLKPGARVALVGGSGSGKSTISRIIAGLQPAWSGELLFDGMRRERIPRHLLNQSIAMVDQDIFLFEGSIRDNLTLWDKTIPEQDILAACQDADIQEMIVSRPGGLESKLFEGGSNLSGGQRQRIEIARALATNPTILILDEATSALDPVTEKLIDGNLRRRGCTCIIVAHRLSTIRDADEIIVLDGGKIVQRGIHEEMKEVDGLYARLIAQE